MSVPVVFLTRTRWWCTKRLSSGHVALHINVCVLVSILLEHVAPSPFHSFGHVAHVRTFTTSSVAKPQNMPRLLLACCILLIVLDKLAVASSRRLAQRPRCPTGTARCGLSGAASQRAVDTGHYDQCSTIIPNKSVHDCRLSPLPPLLHARSV